jgi:hypothetical protein
MNFFFKKYSKRQRILQQSQITFAVGHWKKRWEVVSTQ